MEVHHHPDLHHKRKKFKEYFLEFLMIFLAGSQDFLADNQGINRTDKNPPLRTMDSELLRELSVFAIYMNGSRLGVLDAEKDLQISGAELIDFLRNEYQVEKE